MFFHCDNTIIVQIFLNNIIICLNKNIYEFCLLTRNHICTVLQVLKF